VRRLAKIVCLSFLFPSVTLAYSPLNTDDAGTIAKGSNQIEQYFFSLLQVGQDSSSENAVSSGEDFRGIGDATAFPLSFSRGLTNDIELNFSPTYYLQPLGNFSRVSNYTLNLKWRFVGDGEKGLNLAVRPTLIAPASTTQQEYGIGNANWNYGLNLIASQLADGYEIHMNAGYTRAPYNGNYLVGMSPDPSRTNLYYFSVAPVWKVTDQFKLAIDVGFGTNPAEPATSLTTYGQIALIYSPDKNIDLGLSYQRNAPSFEVSLGGAGAYTSRIQAGVTYRFD